MPIPLSQLTPMYHCQETLNPETSCGDVKFACLYSSLALAWRTASCKAPNTNKSSPRTGLLKDSIPMPPACVIVVLSRISMPCRQNVDMFDVFCATNDHQWIKQLPPTFRAQDPHNGAFAHPEPWLKAKLPGIKDPFRSLLLTHTNGRFRL